MENAASVCMGLKPKNIRWMYLDYQQVFANARGAIQTLALGTG